MLGTVFAISGVFQKFRTRVTRSAAYRITIGADREFRARPRLVNIP